jgi:hypothetical protein
MALNRTQNNLLSFCLIISAILIKNIKLIIYILFNIIIDWKSNKKIWHQIHFINAAMFLSQDKITKRQYLQIQGIFIIKIKTLI